MSKTRQSPGAFIDINLKAFLTSVGFVEDWDESSGIPCLLKNIQDFQIFVTSDETSMSGISLYHQDEYLYGERLENSEMMKKVIDIHTFLVSLK